ncbi:hypothetical protein TH63_16120 [Rufibacter radiotolerans]|uniref:EF-hand domain-containing protein n=1 Tax=Rufibacter radiotolerans TaxID=1379910 RepID=A0A0H4VS80_9BACT|nr:hypothetical protein [Rufibacter radiotolerans]AKQ46807.1 hypothetical protein TH63_16120 [Rufibacter radiotolerans]
MKPPLCFPLRPLTALLLLAFLWAAAGKAQGQGKYSPQYNQLTVLDSTDMVVASIYSASKISLGLGEEVGLLFINTRTGQSVRVELPPPFQIDATALKESGRYRKERPVIIIGGDKAWNQNDKLDSNDLRALFITTSTGQGLQQVSPKGEHLVHWKMQKTTNALTFITKADSNRDGKFDEKDVNKVYVFHLTEEKLTPVNTGDPQATR